MWPQYLLQTVQTGQYTPITNSQGNYVFLAIIVGVIVLFIVLGPRVNTGGSQNSRSSGFSLRRECKQHGLTPDHYRILKRAIKDQKIQSPGMLFTNSRFLNSSLRQLLNEIENSSYSQATKELLKAEIFEIKQAISHGSQIQKQAISTKSMPINQEVTIYSKTFPPFKSELTGKTNELLAITLPHDRQGEKIHYKVGSPIKIRYVRDEDKVFSFMSQIKDIRDIEGEPKILLPHSTDVKRIQLRKSPRKEFHRSTFFYRVDIQVEGKGRKQVRKAVVDKNRRYSGTMEDISAGGCAVYTRSPLQKSSLIMISFDINKGNTVSLFGKVRNIRKEKTGSLMHIMFTKISTKNLNEIRSFVFGFTEDDEKPRNNYLIS